MERGSVGHILPSFDPMQYLLSLVLYGTNGKQILGGSAFEI